MTLYRDYQPALHPTALAGPYGTSWGASQGTMKDRVITLAVDAVDAGLVLRCTADALPLLGADVALPRIPLESDAEYRVRIAGAWETWRWAGTRTALELVATQFELTVRITTAHDLGRVPWAQWFMFTDMAAPFVRRAWDTGSTWGSGVWGSDASREGVRAIKAQLRRFSNARDRGWFVTLQSTPGVWGAPSTWGAPGVWGGRNPRWRI